MTPLWFMVLSVGIDLLLTPVLILELGPLPEWGILGSSFAMAIANTVALIGVGVTIYLRGSVLAFAVRNRAICWRGALLHKP